MTIEVETNTKHANNNTSGEKIKNTTKMTDPKIKKNTRGLAGDKTRRHERERGEEKRRERDEAEE